jgi:hypothetical protein
LTPAQQAMYFERPDIIHCGSLQEARAMLAAMKQSG